VRGDPTSVPENPLARHLRNAAVVAKVLDKAIDVSHDAIATLGEQIVAQLAQLDREQLDVLGIQVEVVTQSAGSILKDLQGSRSRTYPRSTAMSSSGVPARRHSTSTPSTALRTACYSKSNLPPASFTTSARSVLSNSLCSTALEYLLASRFSNVALPLPSVIMSCFASPLSKGCTWRMFSSQVACQRSGRVVAFLPDERLDPKIPNLSRFVEFIASRSLTEG